MFKVETLSGILDIRNGGFLLNVHERWNMIYRIRVMRESRNISVLQKIWIIYVRPLWT